MWIEIPDEIEKYLCGIDNALNKSSLAINALFESMLKGQHIVYASRILLDKIEKFEYLNPSNKKFISWIKQKYIYLYACRDIIEYKIIVTVDSNCISVENNIYTVPLEYFYDFREAKLLTENEKDGDSFLEIYNFIRKEENISSFFNVKFENDSGHGSNVSTKLLQSAKENRIAICILDGDREMQGGDTGSTYKGANKVYKKIKKNHIILLKELGVREKENLFPPNTYMLLCEKSKSFLNILHMFINEEKIIKYFDIKDGVKYKKHTIKGWERYYKLLIEKLKEEGIYKLPDNEGDLQFVCLEGIGEKICDVLCKVLLGEDEICEELLKDRGVSEEQKIEIMAARKNVKNTIPKYLYFEWEKIHNILFSWGCCISQKKLPFFEM